MSQITLDTDKVWDIGKASEATQKRITELSEGLQSQVKGLSHIEDFIQVYDEIIQRQIRRMKNEAQRCGMTASYIFKIAEHYERTDSGLAKGLSILAPVLDKTRVENDAAFKKVSLPDNFSITRNGEKTVYQYDVKTQCQTDYVNGEKYGDGTVKHDGCGPSSLATCINALNGKDITNPKKMCDYSSQNKALTDGGTIMDRLISSWCKDNPEYKYSTLFGNGAKQKLTKQEALNKLIEALKNGKVATIGTDPKPGNLFSTGQHIVAATGVEISDDGKVRLIISDPYQYPGKWTENCARKNNIEVRGDKIFVDVDVAIKNIASIRILSLGD